MAGTQIGDQDRSGFARDWFGQAHRYTGGSKRAQTPSAWVAYVFELRSAGTKRTPGWAGLSSEKRLAHRNLRPHARSLSIDVGSVSIHTPSERGPVLPQEQISQSPQLTFTLANK
jgi:hypothetical protein